MRRTGVFVSDIMNSMRSWGFDGEIGQKIAPIKAIERIETTISRPSETHEATMVCGLIYMKSENV